jgi:hypothetical protein
MSLTPQEARQLGKCLLNLVDAEQTDEAFTLLTPVLASHTPFRILGILGQAIGGADREQADVLLEQIAGDKNEGGWAVIGAALGEQLAQDMPGSFTSCRAYIIEADVWYACDIFGERVPGPALVADFNLALRLLSVWRSDDNPWVRRTVGVAGHFWTKRAHSAAQLVPQAKELLEFLEPMFEERCTESIKGVGWALKTMGKFYPDLAVEWLEVQVVHLRRKPRALMLHKALTFLSDEQRARITG